MDPNTFIDRTPYSHWHLAQLYKVFADLPTWKANDIEESVRAYVQHHNQRHIYTKLGEIAQLLRLAVFRVPVTHYGIFDLLGEMDKEGVLRLMSDTLKDHPAKEPPLPTEEDRMKAAFHRMGAGAIQQMEQLVPVMADMLGRHVDSLKDFDVFFHLWRHLPSFDKAIGMSDEEIAALDPVVRAYIEKCVQFNAERSKK